MTACKHQFHVTTIVPMLGRKVYTLTCSLCPKTKSRTVIFKKSTKRPRKPLQRVKKPKPTQTTKRTPKRILGHSTGQKKALRRTRLKPMSDEKRDFMKLYREKIDRDTLFGVYFDLGEKDDEPVVVRKVGSRLGCERHHPAGRSKYHILLYRFCTPALHEHIHGLARWARQVGLLLPEFEGRESQEKQPDPLEALTELEELRNTFH